MVAGRLNFREIIFNLLGSIFFFFGKRNITDNCVHRRPNVVAHIEKKSTFSLTALFSFDTFNLQNFFATCHHIVNTEHNEKRNYNQTHLQRVISRQWSTDTIHLILHVICGIAFFTIVESDTVFAKFLPIISVEIVQHSFSRVVSGMA